MPLTTLIFLVNSLLFLAIVNCTFGVSLKGTGKGMRGFQSVVVGAICGHDTGSLVLV